MARSETRKARRMFMDTVGLNPDHLTGWRVKWKGLKQNAGKRDADFTLTFEEYVTIGIESGLSHIDEIGSKVGRYGMARLGDVGPYSYGNCRFLTTTDNIAERTVNGGTSRQIEKMSRSFIATSPDGVEYVGNNLTKFTRDNGLCADYLGKIARGLHVSRLGWKCEYLDKETE